MLSGIDLNYGPDSRVGPDGVTAVIAMGSNLGDRVAALRGALAGLDATTGTAVVAVSRAYETEPVGPAGQGPYLNAAAAVRTELEPRALLARCVALEAQAGRPPAERREAWGPRTLDLDLLLYGELVIHDPPRLCVPHPRLHERWFVLKPVCDVAPDAVHPVLNRRMRDLLADVEASPPGPEPRYAEGEADCP